MSFLDNDGKKTKKEEKLLNEVDFSDIEMGSNIKFTNIKMFKRIKNASLQIGCALAIAGVISGGVYYFNGNITPNISPRENTKIDLELVTNDRTVNYRTFEKIIGDGEVEAINDSVINAHMRSIKGFTDEEKQKFSKVTFPTVVTDGNYTEHDYDKFERDANGHIIFDENNEPIPLSHVGIKYDNALQAINGEDKLLMSIDKKMYSFESPEMKEQVSESTLNKNFEIYWSNLDKERDKYIIQRNSPLVVAITSLSAGSIFLAYGMKTNRKRRQ